MQNNRLKKSRGLLGYDTVYWYAVSIFRLKMEAAWHTEKLLSYQMNTWCHGPEDRMKMDAARSSETTILLHDVTTQKAVMYFFKHFLAQRLKILNNCKL